MEIAGTRVELDGIKNKIESHESVQEALLLKFEKENRLYAYLDIKPNKHLTRKELRLHLGEEKNYNSAHFPKKIFILTAEQLNKLKKDKLPTLNEYTLLPVTNKQSVLPNGELEFKVNELWKTLFGYENLSMDDDFYDLGGHSLLLVKLLVEIENKLKIKISPRELPYPLTPKQMTKIIVIKKAYKESVLPLQKDELASNDNFIFFPPLAGPVLSVYKSLKENLPSNMNFFCVLHPIQNKELSEHEQGYLKEILLNIELMAIWLSTAILEVSHSDRYFLCGWSFGGLLALAVANVLIKRKKSVEYIGLFDTQAPEVCKKLPLINHQKRWEGIIAELFSEFGKTLPQSFKKLKALEHKSYIEQSCDLLLNDLKAENSNSELSKMLVTAKYNLLATLDYQLDNDYRNNLKHIEIYLYMAKKIWKETIFPEAKIEEWKNILNLKIHELSDCDHFQLLENDQFKNQFSKDVNLVHKTQGQTAKFIETSYEAHSERSKLYKRFIPISISISVDRDMPITMRIDDFICDQKGKDRLLIIVSEVNRGADLAVAHSERLVWKNFEENKVKLVPYLIKLNLPKNVEMITDPELYLKIILKHDYDLFISLMMKGQLIVIIDYLNNKEEINEKILNFLKKNTKLIIFSSTINIPYLQALSCETPNSFYYIKDLSQKEIDCQLLKSDSDYLIPEKYLRTKIIKILSLYPECYQLINTPICFLGFVEAVKQIKSIKKSKIDGNYYENLLLLYLKYFDIMFSKYFNKHNDLLESSQTYAFCMLLRNMQTINSNALSEYKWADESAESEYGISLSKSDIMKLELLENIIFKRNSDNQYIFKTENLKYILVARFLIDSINHGFSILNTMKYFGINNIDSKIFSDEKLKVFLKPLLEKYSLVNLNFNKLKEHNGSCLFSILSLLSYKSNYVLPNNFNYSNAVIIRRNLSNLNLSGLNLKSAIMYDTSLDNVNLDNANILDVKLGITIISTSEVFSRGAYSNYLKQFFFTSSSLGSLITYDFYFQPNHIINLKSANKIVTMLFIDEWQELVLGHSNGIMSIVPYKYLNIAHEFKLIKAHDSSVINIESLKISNDSITLASSGSDKKIKIWDKNFDRKDEYTLESAATKVGMYLKNIMYVLCVNGKLYFNSNGKINTNQLLSNIEFTNVVDFENRDFLLAIDVTGNIFKIKQDEFERIPIPLIHAWKQMCAINRELILLISTGGFSGILNVNTGSIIHLSDNSFINIEKLIAIPNNSVIGIGEKCNLQIWHELNYFYENIQQAIVKPPVIYFCFNHDSQNILLIIGNNKPNEMEYWSLKSISILHKTNLPNKIIACCNALNDYFYLISTDNEIYTWNSKTYQLEMLLSFPSQAKIFIHGNNIYFTRDKKIFRLDSSSHASSLIYDFATSFPGNVDFFYSHLHPGSETLFYWDEMKENETEITSLSLDNKLKNSIKLREQINTTSVVDDKKILITARNSIFSWNYREQSDCFVWHLPGQAISRITRSNDGRRLAILFQPNIIWCCEINAFNQGSCILTDCFDIIKIDMPTSSILCVQDNYGRCKIWENKETNKWILTYSYYPHSSFHPKSWAGAKVDYFHQTTFTFFKNNAKEKEEEIIKCVKEVKPVPYKTSSENLDGLGFRNKINAVRSLYQSS